jgi:hypothetical protein
VSTAYIVPLAVCKLSDSVVFRFCASVCLCVCVGGWDPDQGVGRIYRRALRWPILHPLRLINKITRTAVLLLFRGNKYTKSKLEKLIKDIHRATSGARIPGNIENIILDLNVRELVKGLGGRWES